MLDYGYNFMNTKIFIDNESTICIVKNPVFYSKTKHIEIRHHFIRDSNEKKLIQMIKIHTDQNVADLLTKAFDIGRFQYLIAISNSTTEAEYVDAASCYGQVLWIQNQMLDYGYNFMNTKIFIDNESTICIVKNPVFHSKTKHIEIRHHFIRDSNEKKLIQMIKIHTDHNVTDLFTKAFDVGRFQYLIATNDEIQVSVVGLTYYCSIRYVLTVNPIIYTSCIKQFSANAKQKTVNGEVQIQALEDGKKVIVTDTGVRRALQVKYAEGTECLPNATIFAEMKRMGYENLTQKLTFYKAFFYTLMEFLIHAILQCLSAKTTAWNEFSSTMSSAIICLATNQKFNFSKYIFDKNLEGGVKFLMYPSLRRKNQGGNRGNDTEVLNLMVYKILSLMRLTTKEHVTIHSNIIHYSWITKLKERVKKLERRNKSRIQGLKRLRKGRKIDDLDGDVKVTLVDELRSEYNLEGGVKFPMYPRFVQLFVNQHIGDMSHNKRIFVTPSHTTKVFGNMKREGKCFSGRVTPLFQTMMVQAPEELGEGLEIPTDPQHTPTLIQPSTSQPQKKQPRRKQRKDTKVPQPSGSTKPITDETANEEHVPTHSNDPLFNGKDRLKLNKLMELCTNLLQIVLDLENTKTSQAAEITKLKERVKKLERRNKSSTPGLKRLRKVGRIARIESSEGEGLGAQEDASKQGRKIADLDADVEITLVNEAQGRNDDNLMFNTGVFDKQEVEVKKAVSTAEVTTVSATTTTIDELTLAQTSIEIKATKPKAITTAATITTTAVTRPKARGVVVQEPKEEKLAKQRNEDANIAEWDNVQAMIDADYELAARLQAQEQEELIVEEKLKMFVELMDKRKKHFARLGAEEQRRKPPTKSQRRN
ncbi:hypothetical protein Tco_0912450 [Tanacetum coccineum]